ncbi:thymidine kinase [Promicromonospora sp. AC04]|uniref:thymidine kinase n=1 Tax=Promicromonospora sp. AC04 TaxID=2135723 RepID=UPI000D3D2417|nr:thymidine kinase [Promicromonospora sp. AC04]PUB24434.1 thymidine kinase [Promicromonospora sp. AC04]
MKDGLGAGRLEVIAGPMFAGKSEELLRRVRRARIARRGVLLVNHALDTRRGTGRVTSHSGAGLPSHAVSDAAEIPALLDADPATDPATDAETVTETELVAIDEAQFFGVGLVPVVSELADRGLVVVVAGLSVTFDGQPFAPLPELMALAESVEKLTAVCSVCGADAAFHARVPGAPSASDPIPAEPTHPGDALVPVAAHVGGSESYEARCRRHNAPTR